MMEKQLNPFQVYLLKQINLLYPHAANIMPYKSAWLTNNLTCTNDDTDRWIRALLREKYIKEPEQQVPPWYDFFNELNSRNAHHEYIITQKGRDYLALQNAQEHLALLATLENEKDERPAHTPSAKERMVIDYLACLRGKWQGVKIMSDSEHKKLIEHTIYLVNNSRSPKNIKPIPKRSTIPFEFVRKTFHFIYLGNNRVPKTDVWVDFLFEVFDLPNSLTKQTTKDNFPTYRGDYEATKDAIVLD